MYSVLEAQQPSFEWSKRWVFETPGTDVDVDFSGNVYLISYGGVTTNFNPNNWPSILGPTSGCAAVTKLNPNGEIIWVKFIEVYAQTSGGIVPSNITVKDGFIYVAGVFGGGGGVYDFDPGISSSTSNGANPNRTGFIFKWDLDGNYVWHKTIETTVSKPYLAVNVLFVDSDGNVFICGSFAGTLLSSTFSITSLGGGDCFFLKLDSLGSTLILRGIGGVDTSADEAFGICSNSAGDIYLTGAYYLSVDFDPGVGVVTLNSTGSSDLFVSKFNNLGDLIWAHSFGNSNLADNGRDIVLDENENIVFTGTVIGTVSFDLNNGENVLFSSSNYAFITKWNPNGELIWTRGLYSDQGSQGMQLSVFNSQIILAGVCSGITDFDPSQSTYNLSNSGLLWSTFLLRLDDMGNYSWAGILNNLDGNYSKPNGVAQTGNSILLSGWFNGSMNSNPIVGELNMLNSLTNNSGVPSPSNFVVKLGQCSPTTSILNVNACGSYTWALNNQTYTSSGEYSFMLSNANGCDSTIFLLLTLTNIELEICDGIDNDCDALIDEGCLSQANFSIDSMACGPVIITPSNTSIIDNTCQTSQIVWQIQPNLPSVQFVGSTDSSSYNPEIQILDPGLYTLVLSVNSCSTITYYSQQIQIVPAENYYLDLDLDGFGGSQVVSSCNQEVGFVTNSLDCDDTNPLIYPGALESLDSLDNNCNSQIDEGLSTDADGDGFTVADGDCDDNNSSIYPNATELCNGVDDNCNTQIDEGFDIDSDSFSVCNGDCDDTNALIYPGAPEILDSLDNNCDGQIDEGLNPDIDGDGFSISDGDCNDTDININPNAIEICNGIDDDCDAQIDEGFDQDADGFTTCNGDCDDNSSAVYPGAIDIDDNIDNDCDGLIDENADSDGDGYTPEDGDCNDANPNIYPGAPEVCNELDDDCDSLIDEGLDCIDVFFIPNGISPNSDGVNDQWLIQGLDSYPNCDITVVNRWEQTVYHSTGYAQPWDGTYNGRALPVGDYFYVIKLTEDLVYKGFVSIKN